MTSSAVCNDVPSSARHAELGRERGVGFEQPGESCFSRWEDDGGAIPYRGSGKLPFSGIARKRSPASWHADPSRHGRRLPRP